MKSVSTQHDWRKALLSPDATIQQAIQSLNDSALRICLIADRDERLLGIVSDGDIRRGLLRGLVFSDCVVEVMRRDPLVVPPNIGRGQVQRLMELNRIQQVPEIDETNMIIGLHLWEKVSGNPERDNLMIIMAGGMGMRLRPQTETCPKPLLSVNGKPMLEHIIERAKDEGFSRFLISINHLGHMIEDHFGSGEQWGVQISYLREDTPLGTAGSLSLMAEAPDKPFVVTNGDVLTDTRYAELLEFHEKHHSAATMAVRLYEWQHPFGVVQMKGVDIVGFEEKPTAKSHINAGIYALEPEVLAHLKKGDPCDMPSLFNTLAERGKRIVAYPMHEPWLDIGDPDSLEEANKTP